jgi:hypothetical protein
VAISANSEKQSVKLNPILDNNESKSSMSSLTNLEELTMQEKRNHPRFTTAIKVQDIATLKTGLTANISLGGCLIKKSEEFDFFPIASRLTLKFELPGVDEPIVVHGIIRQKGKQREGFGIQFEVIDKKAAYYIEKHLGTFL